MNTLAIDPGQKPGFSWLTDDSLGWSFDADEVPAVAWDEVVIEDQYLTKFVYRNGRRQRVSPRSQISLIRTAERLLLRFHAARQYRIAPTAWRAVLWPGAGRVTKRVVVARLKRDEPGFFEGATDDAVEARGILRAWLKLTPAERKKYAVK